MSDEAKQTRRPIVVDPVQPVNSELWKVIHCNEENGRITKTEAFAITSMPHHGVLVRDTVQVGRSVSTSITHVPNVMIRYGRDGATGEERWTLNGGN